MQVKTEDIKNTIKKDFLPGILNSYSIIFFLENKILAGILMLVSFLNFWSGVSGLFAVLFVIIVGNLMHLNANALRSGHYSFNGLLVGLGMGTFFDPGLVFYSMLALASLLTLLLSVTFGGWLYSRKLPYLSLPFVISFWFVVLPSSHFENLGLTQRNIYWINEMYAAGGNQLLQFFQRIDTLKINNLLDIYLRSLSSVFFQDNLISGFLICIGLIISSRIMFSLSIVGFLTAYSFAFFTGSEAASINYYNIGANYMMVAFAVGGYFLIPSRNSYLWTILLVPLTSLVLLFFYKLFSYIQLPVFSLPFSFVTIIFIYFLHLRTGSKSLIVTPLQLNTPEKNLYTYKNNLTRLSGLYYFPVHLPFMGEWKVSQAHDGEYTHKGEWKNAFDFVITDNEDNTFANSGLDLNDYYCYNKPVFAPADGYVEIIVDGIEDNKISEINTINNWGNSIVIRHLNGLYSQISHLKMGSFKVKQGAYVHRGELLARCGNSGRSPEPHLHFQMQVLPVVGAKTLDYPFAYFNKTENKQAKLQQFNKPAKNEILSPVTSDSFIFKAFNLLPDSSFVWNYKLYNSEPKTQLWETYTDALNQKYIFCAETNSTAYYVNDGIMFYFTAYYGSKNTLLYYFYLSAYKIFLGNNSTEIIDAFPQNQFHISPLLSALHDIVAPFKSFINVQYSSAILHSENALDHGTISFKSSVRLNIANKNFEKCKAQINITGKGIEEFSFESDKIKINAYV